jgi:hypothetical protein
MAGRFWASTTEAKESPAYHGRVDAPSAAMPYRLTWEPEGACRTYFGDVTIAERRASFDAISADPRFDGLRYVLTDYLAVDNYEVTPEATAEIAAMHIGPLFTNPDILIVAVATRPDVLAAIDQFRSYRFTQAPYQVFGTLPEARAWIAGQLDLRK